jgi:hypothetical protein
MRERVFFTESACESDFQHHGGLRANDILRGGDAIGETPVKQLRRKTGYEYSIKKGGK